MELLELVRRSWGWAGIEPAALVDANLFGNLLVRDVDGRVWRVCPEELSCHVIAADDAALDALRSEPGFSADWAMDALVELAVRTVGQLEPGRSYCLKVPAVLGGGYNASDLASIGTSELIVASGDMAHQAAGLSDGTVVRLKVVD